jgi:hypothetical protein
MLLGIKTMLQQAVSLGSLRFVLHISSVAAVDHLRSQQFSSEDDEIPSLSEYTAPYDIFKQNCEDAISRICGEAKIPTCHLRLSAIFSDDLACIQCSALELQRRIGPYLALPIDCNSSANVSRAIQVILVGQSRNEPETIQSVYYYTRPLLLPRPVPYGYYLKHFDKPMESTTIHPYGFRPSG